MMTNATAVRYSSWIPSSSQQPVRQSISLVYRFTSKFNHLMFLKSSISVGRMRFMIEEPFYVSVSSFLPLCEFICRTACHAENGFILIKSIFYSSKCLRILEKISKYKTDFIRRNEYKYDANYQLVNFTLKRGRVDNNFLLFLFACLWQG